MAARSMFRFFLAGLFVSGCSAIQLREGVGEELDQLDSDSGADQILNMVKLKSGEKCLGGWNAINPSFSPIPNTTDMAVAFRGLCMTKKGGHAAWYNDMIIGKVARHKIFRGDRRNIEWESLEVSPDPRFHADLPENMAECAMPALDKAVGPEDPRLVRTGGGLFAIVTGYELLEKKPDQNGRPVCKDHGMLLFAAKVFKLSPPAFGSPVKLTFPGMGMVEKNWAMFVPPHVEGSSVHAVYSIYPHKVAHINLHTGTIQFIAETKSLSVETLAKNLGVKPSEFHGGSGVAHVKTGDTEYYLSMMHVSVVRQGAKIYWNFPYKFSAKPPYRIIRIGKRLPLVAEQNPAYGELVAFVTTIMIEDGAIFVAYGSGDRSSRTLRMPYSDFQSEFFPASMLAEGMTDRDDLRGMDLEPSIAFHMSNCSISLAAGCSDDLTPSVCRACHGINAAV